MGTKNRLRPVLERATPSIVERDPSRWHKYCTPPLWVAPLPTSAMSTVLKKGVQNHLDFLIQNQTEEGVWEPFWTWGDDHIEKYGYEAGWEDAKREWKGHLAVDTLTSLRAFGRIEKEAGTDTKRRRLRRESSE